MAIDFKRADLVGREAQTLVGKLWYYGCCDTCGGEFCFIHAGWASTFPSDMGNVECPDCDETKLNQPSILKWTAMQGLNPHG